MKHGKIMKLNRDGSGIILSKGIRYIIRPDSISRRARNSGRIHPNSSVTFEIRNLLDGRVAMSVTPEKF
jgi:hypothetical protein